MQAIETCRTAALGGHRDTCDTCGAVQLRALATVFRAKYLDALRRAFAKGALVFAGSVAPLADPAAFAGWLDQLRQPEWVVYAKRPFAGPMQVLEYLGRYTHRVAISNDRLLSLDDGLVRFRWKDYADAARVKVMEMEADEFIRRFLLHVVPNGFVRIRHFGVPAGSPSPHRDPGAVPHPPRASWRSPTRRDLLTAVAPRGPTRSRPGSRASRLRRSLSAPHDPLRAEGHRSAAIAPPTGPASRGRVRSTPAALNRLPRRAAQD
jgi:hypothetical protein